MDVLESTVIAYLLQNLEEGLRGWGVIPSLKDPNRGAFSNKGCAALIERSTAFETDPETSSKDVSGNTFRNAVR